MGLIPLIAPRHVSEFSPDDYHAYVTDMYQLRTKGRKPVSPAPGLTVSKTKSGKLSIRRSKQRSFDYVTMSELAGLARSAEISQADLFNAFKKREFVIGKDRLDCERIYAEINGKVL